MVLGPGRSADLTIAREEQEHLIRMHETKVSPNGGVHGPTRTLWPPAWLSRICDLPPMPSVVDDQLSLSETVDGVESAGLRGDCAGRPVSDAPMAKQNCPDVPSMASSGSDGRLYSMITEPAQLPAVVAAVGRAERIGLDLQTTGPNPRTDRVRALTLAISDSAGNV